MVIGDNPPFLFVHIPKTAGLSLTAALGAVGSRSHALCAASKHETAEAFIARHGRDVFERFHSFAVVRHPTERLASHFAYLKTNPGQFPEMDAIASLDDYVDAIARDDPAVIRKPERAMAQWRWVYDVDGQLLVDDILRFEDLDRDFADLCPRIGLPDLNLGRANVSNAEWKTVTPRAEAFAREYYRRDFEIFGYD